MDYEKYWHSSAHIMAAAVKRLWPDVKAGIGPAIENGFYYEFYGRTFSKEDLDRIEEEMRRIIKEKSKFVRKSITKAEGKKIFKNEPFKLELLKDLEDKATIYKTGDFVDLCRGPHIDNTGEVKEIKLLKVAASYWKGDSKRESMQRIYGTSFSTKKEMKDYLAMIEEAEKRDHRKIGKEMELFEFNPLMGPGMPLIHPNGRVMERELMKLIREFNDEMGYKEVWTPHVGKLDLWKISGHYEAYREKMFAFESQKTKLALKPMNCPFHLQIYKSRLRSYKELPVRYSEFATVYRNEQSGELHGLMRVVSITQDDRHSICRFDQIEDEVIKLFNSAMKMYKIFGMDTSVRLATKPEKRIGSDELWERAEQVLKKTLEKYKINYTIDEGEGAFYGPKIDIHAKDAIGRKWQLTTIQLDFFMPERFGMEYVTDKGKEMPMMIHCAILGAIERVMGVLIEHYAGKFPVWLSPIQVMVLPITDRNTEYAENVKENMRKAGIRAELNDSQNTLQYKIREAQTKMRIPYLVVIGDKEQGSKKIAVRDRSNKTRYNLNAESFIKEVMEKINKRSV
jgi:threonyl-tRNA synthetase